MSLFRVTLALLFCLGLPIQVSSLHAQDKTFGQKIKSFISSPFFYKPAAIASAVGVLALAHKCLTPAQKAIGVAAPTAFLGIMRYNGSQAALKHNKNIIAEVEKAIQGAFSGQTVKDDSDFCAWRHEEYPDAHQLFLAGPELWNILKSDFATLRTNRASDELFAVALQNQIRTQKSKLANLKVTLKECLQAYNISSPDAWIGDAWTIQPTIENYVLDVESKRKTLEQNPTRDNKYAYEQAICAMNAYCKDNVADFIKRPGKALKRWILYPLEGRAATAYKNITNEIDRLTVLENICEEHKHKWVDVQN